MPARKSTTERRFHSASRRRRSQQRSLAAAAAAALYGCCSSPTSVPLLVAAYNANGGGNGNGNAYARNGNGNGYNSVAPWGPTTEQSWRQQRTRYANYNYGDNARAGASDAFSPDRMRDRGGQLANYYGAPNHNYNHAVNDASFGDNAHGAAAYYNNPAQRLIQGGSRRQYAAYGTQSDVHLSTDGGRPLDARVQMWDGPDNASHTVRVWSEDGTGRPISMGMERADHRWGGGGAGGAYGGYRNGSLDVRNRGPMEYPIRAGVGHRPPPQRRQPQQQQRQRQQYAPPSSSTYARGGAQRRTAAAGEKIQGGTVRHFSIPPTASSVRVTLESGDGLPIKALVELLQGPGRVAQLAEVSNQHGKPFVATFPTPGYGSTIAVRNDGPLEYPFHATVEPVSVEGGKSGGGMGMGMGGSGGMGMGRENRYGDYGSGGTYGGGGYTGGYGYNNNGGGGGGTTGSYGGGYQYN